MRGVRRAGSGPESRRQAVLRARVLPRRLRPMNDRIRLPLRFDAAAMQDDLRRLDAGDWIRHFVKQNYAGDWDVLPLRASATAKHPVQMIYSDPACDAYVDTPLLAVCPAFAAALAIFECPLE